MVSIKQYLECIYLLEHCFTLIKQFSTYTSQTVLNHYQYSVDSYYHSQLLQILLIIQYLVAIYYIRCLLGYVKIQSLAKRHKDVMELNCLYNV